MPQHCTTFTAQNQQQTTTTTTKINVERCPHTRETYLGNLFAWEFFGFRVSVSGMRTDGANDCLGTEPRERANTAAVLATIAHTPHGPERQRIRREGQREREREKKRWQNEFKRVFVNENKMRRAHMAWPVTLTHSLPPYLSLHFSPMAEQKSSRKVLTTSHSHTRRLKGSLSLFPKLTRYVWRLLSVT